METSLAPPHKASPPLARRVLRKSLVVLTLVLLFFFSFLMLRITLEYLPVRDKAGFLAIKQEYLPIFHWKIAFFIHVFTSIFALLAGFTQFSKSIRFRWPVVHRWIGKIYVIDVIFVTGPAGFIMGFYANGGPTSRVSFVLLATLWIFSTAMAWKRAMQRNFLSHRDWMIRSYALTLSAVALRGWKWLLVVLFQPHPMDVYRLVAWLGWVPNLIVAELLIYFWLQYRRKSRTTSALP
jgi:hypothetical protein